MQESELYQTLVAARDSGKLASLLREYIERYKAATGLTSGELVRLLGKSAGISASTVRQIVRGNIKGPPEKRLQGFARVFSQLESSNGGSCSVSDIGDVTDSRPQSFEMVWTELRAVIGDGLELASFPAGGTYRFECSDDAVVVKSGSETKRLPKAWIESTWSLLSSGGFLSVSDLQSHQYSSVELLVLLSNLPYVDYVADSTVKPPRLSMFLVDHVFTNGQLSDVFGVSNSGGIRYSGKAEKPRWVVFISGAIQVKSSVPYRDRWDGNLFHYTGEGLRGDQTLTRGNLALKSSIENGCPIYGFEKLAPDRYKYLGRFRVVDIGEERQPDADGNDRRVYVFRMERVKQKTWAQITSKAYGEFVIENVASVEKVSVATDLNADGSWVKEEASHIPGDQPGMSTGSLTRTSLAAREYRVASLVPDWDWRGQMQALIAQVLETGFFFEPWEIAAYVTALRTKPFVILAGISGTGKSKLPQLVARACGYSVELIPVRPDWTDSSDLLGYVDLSGTFRPGRLLQLAREAEANLHQGYVVVLDEMNLARVEHYFAEVLSRFEERYVSGKSWFCNPLINATGYRSESVAERAEVGLPPNLAIVGTVNMDESTHGFSRKVLDRAFTLELSDVKLSRWGQASSRSMSPGGFAPSEAGGTQGGSAQTGTNGSLNWPAAAMIPGRTTLAGVRDLSAAEQEAIARVVANLERLNAELKTAQLQVGYRARDEVALFVINAMDVADSFVTTDGEWVDPLDLAISMKVLPRIIGGSSAVRRVLAGVLAWATGRRSLDDRDVDSLVDEWRELGRPSSLPNYPFPRCASRLCLMWERLMDEGFTSYWL